MERIFEDRRQAGHLLAVQLGFLLEQEKKDAILIALPRGGVPVAHEVAMASGLPINILAVRKIGHPLQPEYGIGAITEEGFYWMDPEAVGTSQLTPALLAQILEKEKAEIARRVSTYRKDRPLPSMDGKTIILIDDGLATGVTARVAAKYVKSKGARKVVLAVPVCSVRTAHQLRMEIDELICLTESSLFFAVGQFYLNFEQVSDEQVLSILTQNQDAKTEGVLLPNDGLPHNEEVNIPFEAGVLTKGFLSVPAPQTGFVIFAHGSGSSRFSIRNQQVAEHLNQRGFGTLLFDLLTEKESLIRSNIFDIPLLAKRLVSATKWVRQQKFARSVPIGYFGASTGGGAALWAAAEMKQEISAVVSRGGRPDLAIPRLQEVTAPTLLLVGDQDTPVIHLNEKALKNLNYGKLSLIVGATHLFEEPGTLEQVSALAAQWFELYLTTKELQTPAKVPSESSQNL